jgi:hypothetical protein
MHFDSQMGGISLADCRLPRISLVFREMWETTNLDVLWSSSGELSAATTFRTLHPNNQLQGPANHLKLVTLSEAEGPAVRLSAATTLRTMPRCDAAVRFVISGAKR